MKKLVRLLERILFVVVFLLLCCAGALLVKGYQDYKTAVEFADPDVKFQEIRRKESFTPYEELPDMYKAAVLAVEDKRFFRHGGFDLLATGRALYHDMLAGSFVEGGSTITQQLAKNLYFTQEKKLTRKIAEVFAAFDIEKRFTKEEIFEAYVNQIYFGEGYESVAEASYGYFGKAPADMNEWECTLLAGIPNAPSVYSPAVNPELSRQRQRQVLDRMVECKYLTDEEAEYIFSGEILLAKEGEYSHGEISVQPSWKEERKTLRGGTLAHAAQKYLPRAEDLLEMCVDYVFENSPAVNAIEFWRGLPQIESFFV